LAQLLTDRDADPTGLGDQPDPAAVPQHDHLPVRQHGPDTASATVSLEKDLKNNLYRIWNRMSSGSYFPPAVRAVPIPKRDGVRILGVPTIADRIAQTVVARRLEPRMEEIFRDDSYGYRVGRSAIDGVRKCRERCWKFDWAIDLDVQKFFDSCPHDLIVKPVKANTDQRWIVLYVTRWLVAPVRHPDGALQVRDRGTPQGCAVSPCLANLFLHYAFYAEAVVMPGAVVSVCEGLGAGRPWSG
jgi:group II intron reverse transcriptase/maturase